MRKWNLQKDWDEIQALLLKQQNNYLSSGWKIWDEWFGGFRKGTLQLIAAPTGHGKTTILTALAKKSASQGYRTLYIGTEQVIEMLASSFGPINVDFVLKTEGIQLSDCIGEDQYDVIIYDYLGAESAAYGNAQEWQVFRDQANYLSNFAIEHNACVLTAAQANTDITDKKMNIGDISNSGKHVSFAKHIVDKISAGVYILRRDGLVYMIMMKNRYGLMITDPAIINIDYKNKEVF